MVGCVFRVELQRLVTHVRHHPLVQLEHLFSLRTQICILVCLCSYHFVFFLVQLEHLFSLRTQICILAFFLDFFYLWDFFLICGFFSVLARTSKRDTP